MTDAMHDALRDRMPDVARGSATWSATEAAHLAECADCRAEWALIRSAGLIGRKIEAEYDAAAAARGVTARLRSEPVVVRNRFRPFLLLATAAALALLFARPAAPPTEIPVLAGVQFLPELDSLSVEELTLVADAFDAPLTDTPMADDESASDLDTTQLERVMRSLEG